MGMTIRIRWAALVLMLAFLAGCGSSDATCTIVDNGDGTRTLSCDDGTSLVVDGRTVSASGTIAPGDALSLSHDFADGAATYQAQFHLDGLVHDHTVYDQVFDPAVRDPLVFAPVPPMGGLAGIASAELLAGGNVAVVWSQEEMDGFYHFRVRVYTPAGVDTGADPIFGPSDDLQGVSMAALDGGGFVVAWADSGPDLLQYQVFDAAGALVGGTEDFGAHMIQQSISLSPANGGGFVATFVGEMGLSHVVEAYDAAGVFESRIATLPSALPAPGPQVRRFSDGRLVLSRRARDSVTLRDQNLLTFLAADGSGAIDVFLSEPSPTGSTSVAISAGDQVMVAYEEAGSDIGVYGVFESDGTTVRGMNQFTAHEPFGSRVAAAPGGGFVIAFSEDESANGIMNVYDGEGRLEASDILFGGIAYPSDEGLLDAVNVGDTLWLLNRPHTLGHGLRFDILSRGTLRLVDAGGGEVRLENHGAVTVDAVLSATGS